MTDPRLYNRDHSKGHRRAFRRLALPIVLLAAYSMASPVHAAQSQEPPPSGDNSAAPSIGEVRFSPSGYFSNDELKAFAAPFLRKPMDQGTLQALLAAITKAYAGKGVELARPILRQANAASGLVEIELFEARIGKLASNSKIASDAYFRWRLGIGEGDIADNRLLDRRLRRLALTDQIVLDARLSPGRERGQTDLAINASEEQKYEFSANLNNYGSPAGNRERALLTFRINGLTKANDPLVLTGSPHRRSPYVGLSYARFVSPEGTVASISVGYDRSFRTTDVDLLSESAFGEFSLSHPIIADEKRRLNLIGLAQYFWDRSTLFDVPFLEQQGVIGSLGLSGSLRIGKTSVAFSPALRVTRYENGPQTAQGQPVQSLTQWSLRADASISHAVGRHTFLSVQAGGQQAIRGAAPFRNNLTVTSPYAVRGYTTGLQLGDSAYFVRSQIEHRANIGKSSLTPFVFYDQGEAFELVAGRHLGLGVVRSVGVGTAFGIGKAISGEVFVARPLERTAAFPRINRLHYGFSINLRV